MVSFSRTSMVLCRPAGGAAPGGMGWALMPVGSAGGRGAGAGTAAAAGRRLVNKVHQADQLSSEIDYTDGEEQTGPECHGQYLLNRIIEYLFDDFIILEQTFLSRRKIEQNFDDGNRIEEYERVLA